MDKKYQFFISSTYVDLMEERMEVIQVILELDSIPVGMELFPAANEDQWTLIKELIDSCDYYILIVGGRYGSLNNEGKSYTQMEYEYALSKEIPIISFIPLNPEEIPVGKTDKDPEKSEKYNAFLELVKQKLCKSYDGPKDLGSAASRSIIKLIKRNPAIGWIRANHLSEESSLEILNLRKKIDLLEEELFKLRNFAPRGTELLEQGEDKFEITFFYEEEPYFIIGEWKEGKLELSWDDIYVLLCPMFMNETTDKSLKLELVNLFSSRNRFNQIDVEDQFPIKVMIDESDFQTIKIQLIALGYIEKCEEERSLKEKETYWKLTPFGEKKIIELKTRKKVTNR